MATDSYEAWAARGLELMHKHNRNMWDLGEWVTEGERRYGETYAQALNGMLLSYGTLATYAWVYRQYESSPRIESLSFSHHRVALSLADADRRYAALLHAEREQLNRDEFSEYVRALKGGDSAPEKKPEIRAWQGCVLETKSAPGSRVVTIGFGEAPNMAWLAVGAEVIVQVINEDEETE